MAQTQHTIYKLSVPEEEELSSFFDRIIKEYNDTKKSEGVRGNKFKQYIFRQIPLANINSSIIYIGKFTSPPEWQPFAASIAEVPKMANQNNSLLYIIETKSSVYAITTGIAHNVIKGYIDSTFGLDLLSKLIDQRESNVKSVADKTFFGNRYGGNQFFSKEIQLMNEKNISSYFKEINSKVTKKTIEDKLGVKIKSKKKNYSIFAKDSFKLSKALDIYRLDELIGRIDKLLIDEDATKINDFYKINDRSKIYKDLQNAFLEKLLKFFCTKDTSSISFNLPLEIFSLDNNFLVSKYSSIPPITNVDKDNIIEKTKMFFELFKEKTKLNKDIEIVKEFLRLNWISNNDNDSEFLYKLKEIIECQVFLDGKLYYLLNGEWFLFEHSFIKKVNKSFKEKTENILNASEKSIVLNEWKKGIDEGPYNASHYTTHNILVLDKIFVKNIEICDLLIVEENDIYLVHVKKGLAGDTRILCEQIIIAASAIQNYKEFNDDTFIEDYYKSIIRKLKTVDLKAAAEDFIKKVDSKEKFKSLFDEKKVHFVFAYSYEKDILMPEKISSTPAKVSMLELFDRMRMLEFPLHIYKIKN
ncbi:DUF6119 family protein [Planomicrobium okeanokoites]|uniref:DUF6119 family protein n=1 Tax=Planomicrobium okeanokoites TaxID=244 RepID=UPI0030F4DAB8